jgi:broad specificity phosphatase PhoE
MPSSWLPVAAKFALMDIILIRHAQPGYVDAEGIARNNPPLTALGYKQADMLEPVAAAWRDEPFQLLVSPLIRARETMAPIEKTLYSEATVCDWMQEIGVPPQWEGAPGDTVDKIFAEARRRPPEEWWEGLEGGESFRAFHDRVWAGFELTLADHGVTTSPHHSHLWKIYDRDLRLVFVAHGGTNGLLLARLLGADPVPWEWERFSIGHASVSRLTSTLIGPDHIFSLRSFAETMHIPPDQVTA